MNTKHEIEKSKVLIVDDLPDNLIALEKVLNFLEADIYKASGGQEALALMLRHTFALVLMDVQMPDLDGFEVAELMKSYEETKDIPLIFITAINKEEKYIFKGYESGAVDYLFKPIEPDILMSKVKVFLNLNQKQTELCNALIDVKNLSRQNQQILNSVHEGILGLNITGTITFANPSACRMLMFSQEELIGRHIKSFLEENNIDSPLNNPEYLSNNVFFSSEQKENNEIDKFCCRDGKRIPVEYSCSVMSDNDDDYRGHVLVFQDVTDRKLVEEKLIRLANFDSLTGIANRTYFHQHLQNTLSRAERHDRNIAVLFMDLDYFKEANDRLGHDGGDLILIEVADRLKNCLRTEDMLARLGGDEFAVILEGIAIPEDAAPIAQKIIDSLDNPYYIYDQEILISVSIGIATYPEVGKSPDALLKAADTAMYSAKEEGRKRYQYFIPDMQKRALTRSLLQKDLKVALNNNEFSVNYQILVSTETNKPVGVEQLLRWTHIERGNVSPTDFISVAEELGIIVSIGEWSLLKACNQIKQWRDNETIDENFIVSINLSARQLKEESLVPFVANAIKESGINPKQLEMELTETAIMDNPETAIKVLNNLHELGISIAIDDFGTGYSSLSYLTKLPVETLKIDRVFVKDIVHDVNDEVIIKATIAMAHNMGLKVIAEGVENTDQIKFLKENNCDVLQGFYFSKPESADKIAKKLSLNKEKDYMKLVK